MTVPYLIDFVPYSFSGELCQSIEDMVSVSLQQRTPSNINYDIGSIDDVNIPVSIKNITNNTKLEVTVTFNNNVFVADDNKNINKITVVLEPDQIRTVAFVLNKQSLDNLVRKFETNITISIKNITNGGVVTRNVSVSKLPTSFLEQTIL